MQKQFNLNLAYKGKRLYIQGADLYNEMVSKIAVSPLEKISELEFLIHNMTDQNLVMYLDSELDQITDTPPEQIASLKFKADNHKYLATVYTRDGAPQTRQPYDELLVTNYCNIDRSAKRITLNENSSGYSAIEILVAMNKALHLSALSKPDNTSWVFCRWECGVWPLPSNLSQAEITIEQALGSRLTKSHVVLEGHTLGYMYFSAKKS